MIKTGYKLYSDCEDMLHPILVKTTVEDPECVSWQEAKKQLRKWYLDQAKTVRSMRPRDVV